LQSVLDSLSREDFQRLGTQPEDLPLPHELHFDREFSRLFIDRLMERWSEVDPAGALAVARAFKAGREKSALNYSNELFEALARVRPELILAEVDQKEQPPMALNALQTLAGRDLASARKYSERFPMAKRGDVEAAIAKGIAQSDPVRAMALARELDNQGVFAEALQCAAKIGGTVVAQVLEANAGKFPIEDNVRHLMLLHPELGWENLLAGYRSNRMYGYGAFEDARRMTSEERSAVLTRLDQLPPGARDDAATVIASTWAREEPRAAVEWAFARIDPANGDSPSNRPLPWAFHEWVRANHTEALEWLSRIPPSTLRDRLAGNAAGYLVGQGETDLALGLFKAFPGPESTALVQSLASAQASRDPAAAAAWLDSVPSDISSGKAAAAVAERWFEKDPAGAAQWVERLPAGERREQALGAYAKAAADRNPAAAAEWAAAISDPELRSQAAQKVFGAMIGDDPVVARNWLRTLPGVDERWKQTLIRSSW
jgi:hypothetical protein